MEVAPDQVGRGLRHLAGVRAVPFPPALGVGGAQPLLAHHAAHPLLARHDPGPAHPGVHGSVAAGAVLRIEQLPDQGPYVGIAVASAGEPGALVLIGALRYPQETGDLAEGQACLPPQSLAGLALAPVRDRSRVPPARF